MSDPRDVDSEHAENVTVPRLERRRHARADGIEKTRATRARTSATSARDPMDAREGRRVVCQPHGAFEAPSSSSKTAERLHVSPKIGSVPRAIHARPPVPR